MLGAVVAEELYRRFPDADEGWLSRARATVVRASTLAAAAEEIDLGSEMRLGKGEEATGGREKPSIMADALEALIGAVHLDAGRAASATVVMNLLGPRIVGASGEPGHLDDKSRLQELASREERELVAYRVTDTGPEHDKTFVAAVRVGARTLGTGTGRSKKQAEQLAARAAYDVLTGVAAVSAAGAAPTPPTLADAEPAPNDEAENA